MKWFYCMDMHSGGGRKTKYEMYFIEAETEEQASERFTEETGEDPNDVACECCGQNFSLGGGEDTLLEATAFWRRGDDLDSYIKNRAVCVIPAKPNEETLI